MEQNHTGTLKQLSKVLIGFALLMQVSFAWAATTSPGITYTGRIMKADGVTPVTSSGVTFSIAIYDVNKSCLMFTETRTLDLSSSGGTFSFDIGDGAGAASYKGNVTDVFDIFNNAKAFTGMTCGIGTGFTALVGNEPRTLMVSFDAGDGNGPQTLPALKINPVPMAGQSYNTQKLAGYGTGDLLRINTSVDKTTNANTDLTQAQYDEFWRLVKNPTTAYLTTSTSGALSGDVTGTIGANTVTKLQGYTIATTAPSTNYVLTWNGSAWAPAPAASSGLSTTLNSAQIYVGNASNGAVARTMSGDASLDNTGVLTLASTGVTAGSYAKVTVDLKGRVTAGAALASSDVTTALGFTPSSAASSLSTTLNSTQFFVGNASNIATAVNMTGDASLANTGAVTLATTGVTAGTYTKITVDAKGRATVGASLASSDVTAALGFTPVSSASGLTTALNSANFYLGNASNIATAVTMSGDASMANTGAVTFATTGVTAGTYTKITVDAKGRATVGASLASADVITALGFTPANSASGLPPLTSGQVYIGNASNIAEGKAISGDASLDNAGVLTVNKTTTAQASTILALDGSSVANVKGVSIATGTGSIALNSAGTTTNYSLTFPAAAPGSNSMIPFVSTAGVMTWGTLPSSISTTLNSTQFYVGNASNVATAVNMTGDASLANTGAVTLATTGVTAGTYTKITVDAKGRATTGASLASADVISALGFTPANSASGLPPLTSGQIFVGNASNIAEGKTMSGDASMANTGVVTFATTGVTAGTYTKITVDAKGRATTGASLASSDVTSALGFTPISSASGLTTALNSANFYLGNASNIATAVTMSGDASMANTGAVTFATTGVTAGTYTKITVDAKGRATVGASLASSDVTAALGFTPVSSASGLTSALNSANFYLGNASNVATAVSMTGDASLSNAGVITVVKTTTGTASTILSLDGSGVANVKGVSISTGTGSIALNSAGTTTNYSLTFPAAAPGSNSMIPLVSTAGVMTWGTLPSSVSTTLNSTQFYVGNASNVATAVNMTGDASLANTGAVTLATTGVTAGTYTKITVNAKGLATAGTALASSDVTTALGFTPVSNASGLTSALNSANFYLGNASNIATAVTMSGDASMANTGAVTFATTGVTAGTYTKITVDAKGRATVGASLASSDVTTALGFTPVSNASGLTNALNSTQFFVGNASNIATAVNMTGDASLANTGAVTLATTGVTAGTYTKITVNAKGLATVGASLASSDITTALGFTPVSNASGLTSALNSANFYLGNASNIATAVTMSGDASMANTGAVTFATTGVTAGTYTKITVDAKGRATTGASLASADVITALGFTPADNSGNLVNTLASAKIFVGNASNVAMPVNMTGDASITNAGVVSVVKTTAGLASTILSLDGSGVANVKGVSINTGTGSIALNSAGTTTNYSITFPAAAPGSNGMVMAASTAGVMSWVTPATSSTAWMVNGNTAGAAAWIGNSDGYDFSIKTNNVTRATFNATTGEMVVANQTRGPLGSVSAPTYGNSTAYTTGMFFPTSTTIGFTVNGTSVLTLSSTGVTATVPVTATTVVLSGTSATDGATCTTTGELARDASGDVYICK